MLPGQSHQISSMGMPPGYAPMMQWEDQGGMPQQVIMMTAPTGQQIALTSVYPMPQNAMVPGQQRFMPPPPPYSVQMASSFRTGVVRNNEPLQMTDEQRKKMEKEAKQRQFMEQQRRLQGLSNLGSVKMDPDKLIESIIGKSETAHRAPTARTPAAPSAKGAQGVDSGEDVFGDFLSGSSGVSPARGVAQHSTTAPPPSNAASYAKPNQLGNNVSCENNMPSSAGEISSVKKTEGAPKEKKDLASMMMQCSDLTAPKEAKRFEKRKTVNEVQVTKAVSVTYNESKAARHWDSSTEALSELFMLPASPASQPSATFETFEGNATSPVVTSEFRLPPWITGEIPIHNLYQQVLEAVTRDGVILTELVYPILLQSGLPREALGYIWELCNRYTPGQLIREELFLILAMVSIAQNGLDYSSLAILSKCPQSPVPSLGQLLGSPVPLQTPSFSGAALGELSAGNTTPVVGASAHSSTASFPSQTVDPASYPQRTAQMAPTDLAAPDGNWCFPGQVQNLGYAVHEGSLPISSFSCQSPPASVLVASQSTADDDEFEQFQAAPLPLHGLSLPSVNSAAGPAGMPLQLPKPHTSRGEFELMKMDDDKYAALRDLSSFSTTESEADVSAAVALENQTTSAVTEVTVSTDTPDLEFADFASFSDTSASDIPASHVSTFSDNSYSLSQSQSAANVYFGIRNQDVDEFSSFSSQMKSGAESARDFATVKPHVMESSSGFAANPLGGLLNSLSASLSGNGLDDHIQHAARAEVRVEEDGEWASFSSSGDRSFSQTDQSRSSTLVSGHAKPVQGADVRSDGSNLSKGVGGWAEFESASNLDKGGGMFGENQRSSSANDRASFPGSSKQTAEAKHANKTRHENNISTDKVRSFFGQVNDNTVTPVGIGISPLDFHPPDLPDEDDDFDDFAAYPTYTRDGNSAGGISSLSMHYLEDEHFDSSSEEKAVSSAAVNGKTFTVLGMTQSNSSNSLEFTGWKLQSGAAVKEPDVHSTSSLELTHNKTSDFRDESPQQDGDSQSVSSLDFPPIESEQKSTTDEQSVASLELKPTSPESDAHPSGDSRTSDKVPPSGGDARHSGFTFKDSGQGQSHPVDLKELLEQGSLGKFGDRYSELTNEVQDSDRHAYDWQRCLEICNGFLSEGNNTFSSLSSSSVLHEILSTDEGATYLKGLVEIYFVARRIEEEMRFVSVNNSKLASVVKEIDIEWNDLAAICAGSSIMPDLSSLNFQSSFLKADNVEARRKACGVCLLNVDVRNLDVSGDSGSRSLNYGGRQYHTACANFWINCVSKTLPSLTIPELL